MKERPKLYRTGKGFLTYREYSIEQDIYIDENQQEIEKLKGLVKAFPDGMGDYEWKLVENFNSKNHLIADQEQQIKEAIKSLELGVVELGKAEQEIKELKDKILDLGIQALKAVELSADITLKFEKKINGLKELISNPDKDLLLLVRKLTDEYAIQEQEIKELEEQIKQRIDSNDEPLFDRYDIRDFIREYLPDEYSKIMGKFQEWLDKHDKNEKETTE